MKQNIYDSLKFEVENLLQQEKKFSHEVEKTYINLK
jgi:hypothetical protein